MSTRIRFVFALGVVAGLAVAAMVASMGWDVRSDAAATVNVAAGVSSAEALAFAPVQDIKSGEWTAKLEEQKDNKIHLNFERRTDKKGKHQMGQTYDFSDLEGLSREQALRGGAVRFSLVREAGRIDCEGVFQNGRGTGTFRFTGNQNFVSAMKSRGFDLMENAEGNDDHFEDRLFTATSLNITTALADDLLSAGFGKLDVHDLFKAAIFKIDSKFMREMKESGFPNLGMEELVKARIFKIDAAFVRQVSQMGFDKEPFESLVKMQIFKVTPEFITEVRNEGITIDSVEDLVKMRIFKIDSDFIRQARADGASIDVESLVKRKIGVARR